MLNAGYFRTPTVHGDTVVFVSEDDLHEVALAGGVARRLTASRGECTFPSLSPDGSLLAYTSREELHNEVYLMTAGGGQPRRVTYLGANSFVAGWTPAGEIVFRSDHAQPFLRLTELWTVSPEGGQPRRFGLGAATEVSFGRGKRIVLGRNTQDPARWKRYRGGRVGDLWIDATGTGRFERLVRTGGNLAHPMWIGDRIYFISDHEGVGNVYSCGLDGGDLRRHTDHDTYYARFARSDGTTIVYQHGAELWALDPATENGRRIEVGFGSARTQRGRRFVKAEDYVQGFEVHPEGHSIAVEVRGRLFTMPLWERAVREADQPGAVRLRLGQWLADGERVVALRSDATGPTEELVLFNADGRVQQRRSLNLGIVHEMIASPRRNQVALANNRLELILVDLDSGTKRVLDTSPCFRITDLAWAPNGGWLAYAFASTPQTSSIKVCEIATRKTSFVTARDFRDFSPSFDPEGKYLYFLSYRIFDPVYDAFFFDLGFPRGVRPYVVSLRREEESPLIAQPKNLGEEEEDKRKHERDESRRAKARPIRIDLDGIADRVAPIPVPEGRYRQVRGISGKVLFSSFPVHGSISLDWYSEMDTRGSLEMYDFAEQKQETLADGINAFVVAQDGETLVYRAGHELRAIRAGRKPDEKYEQDEAGRRSGWIDLDRIRVSIDPPTEWRQMLREAWRLQRENFWSADLSGVDWDEVWRRYSPLVEKVATRGEFSDLMWDMQGELGTSHAYEIGGDHRKPPEYPLGYLAADLAFDERAGRFRVEHVVRGDAWDPRAASPLAGLGVDLSEGDVILSVNGRRVSREQPPQVFLVNQAEQFVELEVADARGRRRRTVLVKTLRDERPARYREWVERNRAHVHAVSGGRLGYVHIPNMGPVGHAEFHRYYLSEVDRPGLIVDVRFNGGGHVSQIILEKLGRRRIGYDVPRWGKPFSYPEESVAGPIVCLTDENAGSDGDIFTHAFKLMGIGPTVGKRTWGGVIGIWPRHHLADGGVTTQPESATWFSDVGWGLENYGTDPDHDVDIAPQDHAAGRDPQMEKAVELGMDALRRNPPAVPDFRDRPALPLPALPPRLRPGPAHAVSSRPAARRAAPKPAGTRKPAASTRKPAARKKAAAATTRKPAAARSRRQTARRKPAAEAKRRAAPRRTRRPSRPS